MNKKSVYIYCDVIDDVVAETLSAAMSVKNLTRTDNIESAAAAVIVLSGHSADSADAVETARLAASQGKTILLFIVDSSEPCAEMEQHLADAYMLPALPSLKKQCRQLAEMLRALTEDGDMRQIERRQRLRYRITIAVCVAIMLLCAVGIVLISDKIKG